MGRVAARIVSHTTDTDADTKLINYLGSAQSSRGTMDDMRVRRWTGEGLMHAHLDWGGAESTTFDLKFDDRLRIPNGVIHVSYNAKMLSKG